MYKQALKTDLKTIFKVPRVDVGRAVETCIEQGILCADIEQVRVYAQDGQAVARVSGYVGLWATDKENKSGYLIKKINEAPELLVQRFWFGVREETAAFSPAEFELKGHKIRFTYFYKEEYNPAPGPLAGAGWRVKLNEVWQFCCNIFR